MNIQPTNLKRRAIVLTAVVALGLAACGSDDDSDTSDDGTEQTVDGVSMADPWSRQPAAGQTTSAVYGELTNDSDETITAIAATASVSDTVELHEVVMNDDDQMTMREKEGGFEIRAGETFVFEPGGPHIMLLDIDPASYPETVEVTLTFDNDTSIDFAAEVREIGDGAMGGMEDGDGMGDMDEESSEG